MIGSVGTRGGGRASNYRRGEGRLELTEREAEPQGGIEESSKSSSADFMERSFRSSHSKHSAAEQSMEA